MSTWYFLTKILLRDNSTVENEFRMYTGSDADNKVDKLFVISSLKNHYSQYIWLFQWNITEHNATSRASHIQRINKRTKKKKQQQTETDGLMPHTIRFTGTIPFAAAKVPNLHVHAMPFEQ